MPFTSPLRGVVGRRSFTQVLVYSLFLLSFSSLSNAGSFSNFCSSLKCWSPSDDGSTSDSASKVQCTNPKAPKKASGWKIYKSANKGVMPSVADMAADIKLCGNLNDKTTTVFYSLAGGYSNAKKFAAANPDLQVKTINDVLPESWYNVMSKIDNIGIAQGFPQMTQIARTSQALAQASLGDIYLVAGPGANIYTVPYADDRESAWKGAHNVWYDYEFATLQNNAAVKAIYTVDSQSLAIDKSISGSWIRDRTPPGANAGNNVNADEVTAAILEKQKKDYYNQQQTCAETSTQTQNAKRGAKSTDSASGAAGAACTLKPKTTTDADTASTTTGTATDSTTGTAASTMSTGVTTSTVSASITSTASTGTIAATTSISGTVTTSKSAVTTSSATSPATSATTSAQGPKSSVSVTSSSLSSSSSSSASVSSTSSTSTKASTSSAPATTKFSTTGVAVTTTKVPTTSHAARTTLKTSIKSKTTVASTKPTKMTCPKGKKKC